MPATIFQSFHDFLDVPIGGSVFTWGHLVYATLILTLGYLLRKVVVAGLLALLGRLASKTQTQADDILLEAIRVPARAAVVILSSLWAVVVLPIQHFPTFERVFYAGFRMAVVILVCWTATRSIKVLTYLMRGAMSIKEKIIDDRLMPFIEQILKIVVILIGFVMVLQEFGYDPSGLIAGLGLGGLAFALAAKDTLSNFFGSIMLLTDKPFQVGDYVDFKGFEGTVEMIGFRSTHVRLMDKSIVQIPNGILASEPLRNYSRRDRRRIHLTVGITYECTPAMMKAAITAIEDVISAEPRIHQDVVIVRFSKFADSALEIMVHCYTTTAVWAEWLEIQENVLLAVYERFGQLNIPFAYPAMTVHMSGELAPDAEREKKSLNFLQSLNVRALHEPRVPAGTAPAPEGVPAEERFKAMDPRA
jgi:MscS family membrane protein